jgi:polysaccharide pyruvyl transferase WcaK-like protein
MQNSKFIIAARLHGSILAHLLGKRFIMLSYHPKCHDFFNDLNLDNTLLIDEYFDISKFEEILNNVSK